MRTIIHYEPIEVPAKGTAYILPSEATMKDIARARSYRPSMFKMSPGPFRVKLRWDGGGTSHDEFVPAPNVTEDNLVLAVGMLPGMLLASMAIEIAVENDSNEPQMFEAAMNVETYERTARHPVDVMADDIAEDVGAGSLDDRSNFPSAQQHQHKARGKGFRDKLKDAIFGEDTSPSSGDGFILLDDVSTSPKIGKIVKRRLAAIIDNVFRAVEVVVRDAADKLEGDDDNLLPIAQPLTRRDMVLGFNAHMDEPVPPKASAYITVRPQIPFKMRKLIIPDEIAKAFDIEDIKVGKNSQFATANPVPGTTFSASKGGEDVSTDTCQPGMDLTISVRNRTDEPVRFKAAAVGTILEGGSYDQTAARAALRAKMKRNARRFPSFIS